MNRPIAFDELRVGDRWCSRGRTVTETDVVNFAGVTGDFDPLHVDHDFAAHTPFGRPIAHGLLGLSLAAGLASACPAAATVAFLGVTDWEFLRPIYFGDTVHVVSEVVALEPHGRRHGRVRWLRKLFNQRGEVVQSGHFETLVAVSHAVGQYPGSNGHNCGDANTESTAPVSAGTSGPSLRTVG